MKSEMWKQELNEQSQVLKKKIYLAGWDVFLPNAKEVGSKMKQICNCYGFEGLFPLDNVINEDDKYKCAEKIFNGNIELIKESHIIVANLNCFRGAEPDSGTAFECGVGYALGKKLYGYVKSNTTVACNIIDHYGFVVRNHGQLYDKKGLLVEDFNLPLNLMLSIPVDLIVGEFEQCIKYIAKKSQE